MADWDKEQYDTMAQTTNIYTMTIYQSIYASRVTNMLVSIV